MQCKRHEIYKNGGAPAGNNFLILLLSHVCIYVYIKIIADFIDKEKMWDIKAIPRPY